MKCCVCCAWTSDAKTKVFHFAETENARDYWTTFTLSCVLKLKINFAIGNSCLIPSLWTSKTTERRENKIVMFVEVFSFYIWWWPSKWATNDQKDETKWATKKKKSTKKINEKENLEKSCLNHCASIVFVRIHNLLDIRRNSNCAAIKIKTQTGRIGFDVGSNMWTPCRERDFGRRTNAIILFHLCLRGRPTVSRIFFLSCGLKALHNEFGVSTHTEFTYLFIDSEHTATSRFVHFVVVIVVIVDIIRMTK